MVPETFLSIFKIINIHNGDFNFISIYIFVNENNRTTSTALYVMPNTAIHI